jgi:hypothetical protein
MICHFCKARFAFEDETDRTWLEDERQKEFNSDEEAVCPDCDKKFQG